jgi:DNA mismatch repair protein MutH
LLRRARALGGATLAQIAAHVGWAVPEETRRAKGWIGELMERALGAPRSSAPEPDFAVLGIELKTLPVDGRGRPLESTHVCTVGQTELEACTWENSLVRRKLARVLWLPVVGARGSRLGGRRVGHAFLWSPSPIEETALRTDWAELTELLTLGDHDRIRGEFGTCLQVRPKAAHGRAVASAYGSDGAPTVTLPRGFYLRAHFTAAILAAALAGGEPPTA